MARQAARILAWGSAALAAALAGGACNAPISTLRSPYHLRIVEVRNTSDQPRTLKIEPSAAQHLGAATTFTGLLKPGEAKVLYLYHGLEYDFRILDEPGWREITRTTLEVKRDLDLAFDGDSIRPAAHLAVELGKPTVTFADSLQKADPFGLRSRRPMEPDTTSLRGVPNPNDVSKRRGEGQP